MRNDVMSCWLVVVMPQPILSFGSLYPNTCKKPGMACKLAMTPASKPYWRLAMVMPKHITKHFQFARSGVWRVSDIVIDLGSKIKIKQSVQGTPFKTKKLSRVAKRFDTANEGGFLVS